MLGAKVAEYRFRFSEQHLVTTVTRFRQQARSRLWQLPVKMLCFIGMSVLFAFSLYNLILMPSVVLGVLIALLALGPRLDYWFMKRRFRRSPFYNNEMHISLTPNGYAASSTYSRVEVAWGALTKARRFPDGFLVFSGPQVCYWWPDTSLTGGTVAEVENLLKQHVAEYVGT